MWHFFPHLVKNSKIGCWLSKVYCFGVVWPSCITFSDQWRAAEKLRPNWNHAKNDQQSYARHGSEICRNKQILVRTTADKKKKEKEKAADLWSHIPSNSSATDSALFAQADAKLFCCVLQNCEEAKSLRLCCKSRCLRVHKSESVRCVMGVQKDSGMSGA